MVVGEGEGGKVGVEVIVGVNVTVGVAVIIGVLVDRFNKLWKGPLEHACNKTADTITK